MNIHLITYGNEQYAFQRENFRQSAIVSGFFDKITVFTPEDIDPHFTKQFNQILKFRRGGGYWLWKPYFVQKAMDNTKEGDILIYVDAGCMVNPKGKARFDEYINQVMEDETGTLVFQLNFKEYEFTKQEVFQYFRATEELINAHQHLSGIILFRKCAHSVKIIDKWMQAVYDNAWLFTDHLWMQQRDGFIENRHDQSILSMLIKIYGAVRIPDETYFLDFEKEGQRFPFWATRLSHL